MEEQLAALFRLSGIDSFGACRFADCAPLLPCRAAGRLPQGAQSVIVFAFPYHVGEFPQRNVARYAVLPDYHRTVGRMLAELAEKLTAVYHGNRFVPFVDVSPIREVSAAALAGLGAAGRHGLLLHPVYGARVFLGEIVTTLPLSPSLPAQGGCRDCGRCLEACPTAALSEPFLKARCRSHITQKKGALTPWEEAQIRDGALAWGCDICTDACPLTSGARTPIRAFYEQPAPVLTAENLDSLLESKPYGYRGKPVLERNLRLINQDKLRGS